MSDTITARIGNEATVVRNEATDSGVKSIGMERMRPWRSG